MQSLALTKFQLKTERETAMSILGYIEYALNFVALSVIYAGSAAALGHCIVTKLRARFA
jgi:hypothetical protein